MYSIFYFKRLKLGYQKESYCNVAPNITLHERHSRSELICYEINIINIKDKTSCGQLPVELIPVTVCKCNSVTGSTIIHASNHKKDMLPGIRTLYLLVPVLCCNCIITRQLLKHVLTRIG